MIRGVRFSQWTTVLVLECYRRSKCPMGCKCACLMGLERLNNRAEGNLASGNPGSFENCVVDLRSSEEWMGVEAIIGNKRCEMPWNKLVKKR